MHSIRPHRRPSAARIRRTCAAGLALFVGAWLADASPALADRSCQGSICIDTGQEGRAVVFHAINQTAAPVSIRIAVQTQNLEAYPKLPPVQLVPAGGFRKIAQFLPRSESAGWSYRYRWSWVVGDPNATHNDNYRYRMPFGGLEARLVSQGNNGTFTHNGAHAYAFDFAMPVGTPVLAARSGTVVMVNDGYTKHGISDDYLAKANAVYVLHDDRTVATYAHLDPGAGVREGMRIRVGDVIGFSGNTGYSTGPHLHFSVWKPDHQNHASTLPIRFFDARDPAGQIPTTGTWLEPGCHDDGIACAPGALPDEGNSIGRRDLKRSDDGACHCANGSTITTHLPCRMVCPKL